MKNTVITGIHLEGLGVNDSQLGIYMKSRAGLLIAYFYLYNIGIQLFQIFSLGGMALPIEAIKKKHFAGDPCHLSRKDEFPPVVWPRRNSSTPRSSRSF